MERHIDLKKLTLDELAGVINLYPWFGSARKELCRRMADLGGDSWGKEQFADAAMYLPDVRVISGMLLSSMKEDCTDKDISQVIRHYISERQENRPESEAAIPEKGLERVRVAGGDYFSPQEYDSVRKEGDRLFSRAVFQSRLPDPAGDLPGREDMDFCTETLAGIYAEQGYYAQAIHIYEKLILAYPEKNTYFAALIEKLKTED